MIAVRLKQLRLALGLSLDDLAARAGGIVTKQALSKYERGRMAPSPSVLTRLAGALGVKSVHLMQAPKAEFAFLGFRRKSSLGVRERTSLQHRLVYELEKRIRLCTLMSHTLPPTLPLHMYRVSRPDDAERAAERLRRLWKLGSAPISNLIQVIESKCIHVLILKAREEFDGISATGSVRDPKFTVAAVVVREGLSGERQRFSLAHELGHLVIRPGRACDVEKAAHRFAGAFLAPAEAVRDLVGKHRANLVPQELFLLKRHFGMSIAAVLYRLRDLEIIGATEYRAWCIYISSHGWRRSEPEPIPPEEPQWMKQTAVRANAEGFISTEEAEHYSGQSLERTKPGSRITPRELLRMPPEQRRRIVEESVAGLRGVAK